MSGVDLHTHTTASDGTLPPRELVRAAVRRGVRVLAITDHDTTDGLAEAMDEAARHPPLTLVPGLEINCDVPGAEVHVLGYAVDHEAAWFQEFLRAQRAAQREPVLLRHHQVAQHRIRRHPLERAARLRDRSRERDVHARLAEQDSQRESAVTVVVDDENPKLPARGTPCTGRFGGASHRPVGLSSSQHRWA